MNFIKCSKILLRYRWWQASPFLC